MNVKPMGEVIISLGKRVRVRAIDRGRLVHLSEGG
jgi:hypothetical protein